jgi:hypothetical protein
MVQLFSDLAAVVDNHLVLESFVLILTDGKKAQTLFAGENIANMTRLSRKGTDNHLKQKPEQGRMPN